MHFNEAQQDMRRAHYDGATGVIVSATVWLIAAMVSWQSTPGNAIGTLLIGGMFIFPISVALSKFMGRSGGHSKENPLSSLATAGTLWMLLAIPIAYGASLHKIEWFFPAMLLTIGGRYLTFTTLYGLRTYYWLGAALSLAGISLVVLKAPVLAGAFAGASIEYVFACLIFLKAKDEYRPALE
jgi:hypothetical protein